MQNANSFERKLRRSSERRSTRPGRKLSLFLNLSSTALRMTRASGASMVEARLTRGQRGSKLQLSSTRRLTPRHIADTAAARKDDEIRLALARLSGNRARPSFPDCA